MYCCSTCGKTYKTKYGFTNHTCHICHTCKQIFSSKQNLQRHKCQQQDLGNKSFKCHDCQKEYSTENRFKSHKCTFCKVCCIVYSSYTRFQRHYCKETRKTCKSKTEKRTANIVDKTNSIAKDVLACDKGIHHIDYIDVDNHHIYSGMIKKDCQSKKSEDTPLTEYAPVKTKIKNRNKSAITPICKKSTSSKNYTHSTELVQKISNKSSAKSKRIILQSNEKKKDTLDDVIQTGDVQNETFSFKPIDLTWQMNRCSNLHLTVQRASYQLYDITECDDIGHPIDLKKIIGDGNCFFRALSYVLTGTETQHEKVRETIVINMHNLNTELDSILPPGQTYNSYLLQTGIQYLGTWATEVEIFNTANLLKTDIYTYSPYHNRYKWIKFPADYIKPNVIADERAIYLKHTNGDHYDVVLSTSTINRTFPTGTISVDQKNLPSDLKGQLCKDKKERRQMYMKAYMQKMRSNPDFVMEENNAKKIKRTDAEFKKKEQDFNKMRRSDPKFQKFEHDLNKNRRTDPQFNAFEIDLNKKRRTDPQFIAFENDLNKKRKIDPQFIALQHAFNRKRRTDPHFIEFEHDLNKKRRTDPHFIEFEHDLNKKMRTDPHFIEFEHDLNKKRRTDPHFIEFEHDLNKKRRTDHHFIEFERDLNKKRRTDPQFIAFEHELDKKRGSNSVKATDTHQLIAAFQKDVSTACTYVCTSCDQLWFKESVVTIDRLKDVKEPLYSQCVQNRLSFNGLEYVCHTCCATLKKGKLPRLALHNKLNFPVKPEVLDLNSLEERLVAPVSTFFQMRELPSGGQLGIQGNIVNVPSDNLSTVKTLPRHLPESQTIPVKLKRRLRYKSHVLFQNVRPQKCIAATKYLLTKPLFMENVPDGLDETWLTEHVQKLKDTNWDIFIEKDKNKHEANNDERLLETNTKDEDANRSKKCDEEDDWSEHEIDDDVDKQHECDGVYDTMLYPENIDSQRQILSFAPSEGNIPVSSLGDAIEELSFPSIFCGEKRPTNKERTVAVRFSDICKSELRQSDRRAAQNVTNIFFKAKKIQMKQIQDKVWLSLRRVKTKGKTITAKDLKDENNVDNLVKLDDGYRIFRTLRGSPPYWESAKKDLFAMVRQLGLPTWCVSLSAAETRWKPLLQALGNITDDKTYSEEEIQTMTWHNKCRLIKSDPVTTARYFDYRVQKFFHSFLNSPLMPLGKIKEFFYRIEFQQRGSPHVHSVLWVDNAPFLDVSENKEIEVFISQYITTDRKLPSDETQQDLVKLQIHRHTHTCRKKKIKACRFNFPQLPMSKTEVLDPLPSDLKPTEIQIHKEHYGTIQKELSKHSSIDCTFDEFLQTIKMTNEQYVLAIRSSLQETKILIKREPNSIRVNGYNDTVLQAWMANMDIQFITNAYACLMYIVNYVSKGQRGMSNLLRRACEEARRENSDIKHQVRAIGNKFLKHVEISAQEAVYIVLQMKLKNSSCGHIFLNTSPAEERPFIVKPAEQLEKLADNSTDIQCSNVIKRYAKRPKKVEKMCLADFASWYDLKVEKKSYTKASKEEKEMRETDDEDNVEDLYFSPDEYEPESDPQTLQYKNGITLRHRKKSKVIRYVRYSLKKDAENFYRELLMLFMPWRREEMIMNPFQSYEDKYNSVKEEIEETRKKFEHHSEEIEAAEQQIENEIDEDTFDNIAPVTQHRELHDEDEQQTDNLQQIGEDIFTEYDIGADLQCAGTDIKEEHLRNRLSDSDFRAMARSLNRKQMEFFYHVLKISKTSDDQFMLFLSGGAGVGKTRVTKCLYQALTRYYNTAEGENPDQKSILLAAPTGKAAYLIGGVTLHAAFNIPAFHKFQYRPLKHEVLNTMRHQMEHLKLIIIDEISMCGTNLFCFINQRMQEVMGVSKPFGGINVIAIGDLFQLRPVMDSWIFKQPDGNGTEILSKNIWKENFLLYELTDIMRQKDDITFAHILNRIREGIHTADDIKFLKTRIVRSDTHDYPTFATHLLYHNARVDAYNNDLFNKSKLQKVEVKCSDVVIGDISKETKEKIKEKAKDFEMGLSKTCCLAVGLKTDLTINLDLNDGLINGASGIVKNIEFMDKKPNIIWIKFDNDSVGKSLREETLKKNKKFIKWTPIKKVCREFPVGRYKSVKISRKQFPLRLAAAKTIHRAQGDTLSEVVIELPSRKECHMHYVAFSRAEKAENMHILGSIYEEKITVSPQVKTEMERLRTERNMELSFVPLYTLQNYKFKICFHNSQSLHLHKDDIKADFNFREADINIFVESRLCAEDRDKDYSIPGFQIHRNDFKKERTSYGIAAYTGKSLKARKHCLNNKSIEIMLLDLDFFQVVCIYSRPKEPGSNLLKALQILCTEILDYNKTIVIGGDLNCDVHTPNNCTEKLLNYLKLKGLTQQITGFTTDGRTTLDLLFTNCHGIFEFGTIESYFSYHKPVWIALQ